ncbi:MAG: phage baseplate assembly protein [Acinetobacter sp.]
MIEAVQRQIQKGLGQIRQTFLGIVARGGSKMLQFTGFADEVMDEVELIQHVGFSSFVPKDARVVVIPLQGKTSKSVVIATSGGAIVVDVLEGETCIYDQFGHAIWLKEDGAHVKGGDLFIDDGNLHVLNGEVIDKKGSMQEMRQIYNEHTNGNTPAPSQKM